VIDNRDSENKLEAKTSPYVTVIIPAHNVARFIAETVESVFAQTFDSYEVILVNDGSSDTDELERELTPYMSRITYIKQDHIGIAAACNAALKIARGKFVAFLDADDIWLPNHLSEQLALIESGPGYDLVYADAVIFGDLPSPFKTVMEGNPSEGEANLLSLLEGRCSVITTTVVARRDAIFEVGLFDESLPSSQDFDLWLRMAKRPGARITYQPKVLARHRIYEEGLAADDVTSLEVEIRVLEKMARRSDLTPAEQEAIRASMPQRQAVVAVWHGKEQLLEGKFTGAIESFSQSQKLTPNWKLSLVIFSLRLAPRLLQRIYRLRAA
jgi:glycosyltransferase involved in cell wall biosynthesis